jgi:hypothetical protein
MVRRLIMGRFLFGHGGYERQVDVPIASVRVILYHVGWGFCGQQILVAGLVRYIDQILVLGWGSGEMLCSISMAGEH